MFKEYEKIYQLFSNFTEISFETFIFDLRKFGANSIDLKPVNCQIIMNLRRFRFQKIKFMISWQFFGLQLIEFAPNLRKSKIDVSEHISLKF